MDNPALQAMPVKYQPLIRIGVTAALLSSTCTLMWTEVARGTGASEAEIAEAILVSAADEGGQLASRTAKVGP